MNNTNTQPDLSFNTSKQQSAGPSTLEMTVGILALVLALAAVVVAIMQFYQARALRVRQIDIESRESPRYAGNA